jgi:predicted ATPase
MPTANVVDLLQARMKKLEDDIQLLLQYAVWLGSPLKLSRLKIIWAKHAISDPDTTTAKVTSLLTVLEEGKFIESCGTHVYRWVHDKVREVALSLGDAAEASFQF